MKKEISVQQYRSLVRIAQACDPSVAKKNALAAKIAALQEQIDCEQANIDAMDAGARAMTGLPIEALIKKVIIPGTDANGKPTKTTKYVPTDILTYDEAKKKYVITVGEDEPADAPVEEETPVTGDPDPVIAEDNAPAASEEFNW